VSPQHRDPDHPDPLTPARERIRETLIERQIREALEAGVFDDLPNQGEPLPLEDDSAAGEWAMAHRMLRNAGAAPPWIEADKAVRALLAELEAIIARAPRMRATGLVRARNDVTRLVEETNRAIMRVNAEAPTLPQHRRSLDLTVELARLDRAAGGQPPGAVGS
jgi:hypothetical protein